MRQLLFFMVIAALLAACGEETTPKAPALNPQGTWRSHTQWENNDITLTVRPDSLMLFKCIKSFCPGNKYFVAVGTWHLENDSILVMQKVTDGRKFEVKQLFPEFNTPQADTMNIIALDLEGKFIATPDHLYDIEAGGKRSQLKYYDRKQ